MPAATIVANASHREHINGHVVHARPALLDAPGNTDITDSLRAVLTAE
jgi:hypothetical protein